MKFLVLACSLATVSAALQGYSLPQAPGSAQSTGSGVVGISGHVSGGGSGFGHIGGSGISTGAGLVGTGHITGSGISTPTGQVVVSGNVAVGGPLAGAGAGIIEQCGEGQVRHVDGSCVEPVVNRRVYVFDVPEQPQHAGPSPILPPPRVDHNILFVRLPEDGEGPEPIVIPPPRQENIVYVLNKKDDQAQRVIEVLGVNGGAGVSGGFIGVTGGAATVGTNGFGIAGSGGVGGLAVSNTGSGVNFQVGSGLAGFQAGTVIGSNPVGLYSTP
ncbi:uncharacterized protein LOC119587274 [Penaeus monodon]|uniref:uncharacterized protein LOC119587274 n=1 Tax=Penaeus monodon TaxID=6687 RepID=UPI0018A7A104|nr:uncharacterized protein LOC119587274 [Penaeus monodon]